MSQREKKVRELHNQGYYLLYSSIAHFLDSCSDLLEKSVAILDECLK